MRSRKSWGLLAYLLLDERTSSRAQLAQLLFSDADDPMGALRWSLAELRRGLSEPSSVTGDPVQLHLPDGAVVDVDVVHHGSWRDAVALPQLGEELLAGPTPRGSDAFADWLSAERLRAQAATEAILHEAALGTAARGDVAVAISYATRAAELSPYDENHQVLLTQLYRRAGRPGQAGEQVARFRRRLADDLGATPGPALLEVAAAELTHRAGTPSQEAVEAAIESGRAAVDAGVSAPGIERLRDAVSLADSATSPVLRVTARTALAEALIHAMRGFDEEGVMLLVEADHIALDHDLGHAAAAVRAELGYVDFLRGRYDRADLWLTDALRLGDGHLPTEAKAHTYLGSVASDQGRYGQALDHLRQAIELAAAGGELRREAFARSMTGRALLATGDVDGALVELEEAVALADRDRWQAFLPWPQALLGECRVLRGDLDRADDAVRQAFARACELGDPCWEGMAARSMALVHARRGAFDEAFAWLDDGERRSLRLSDPYVWLHAAILDTRCQLAIRHGDPRLPAWAEELHGLAARSGMHPFLARAQQAMGRG